MKKARKKYATLSRNSKRNRRIRFSRSIAQLLHTPYGEQLSFLGNPNNAVKI